MHGITFGTLHSYRDLNLILSKKEIGSPPIKKKLQEVEGADGVLDYTDFFGGPKYGNVTHKFTFSTISPKKEQLAHFSRVKNALHGRKMTITLDEEPGYFYVGRLDVSSFTDERGIGKITVEADCEPWKYKQDVTAVQFDVDGSMVVRLQNSRKHVVPIITTFSDMAFTVDGVTYAHEAGVFEIPEMEFREGENEITITGTGNVRFVYQEGML